MNRTFYCLFVSLAIVAIAPTCAFGTLIAYDGFDYTAGETLIGKSNGSGWLNNWSEYTSSSSAKCMISSTEISAADASGNSLNMNSYALSENVGAYRALDITGNLTGTVYVSFLAVAYDNANRSWGVSLAQYDSITGSYYVGAENNVGNLLGEGASGTNYSVGSATGGHVASSVADTTPQLFVAKVNIDTGAMSLYLFDLDGDYPVSETGLTADAVVAGAGSLGTVNAIRVMAGTSGTGYTYYADANVDEIRVGTEWSDVVVSVPEPSSIAMLACGLIGLLAYAWRKRK